MGVWRTALGAGGEHIDLARQLRAVRGPGAVVLRPIVSVVRSRPEWRREVALRAMLASLPCAVLVLYLHDVLGRTPSQWIAPLAITAANALLVVSLARQLLRGRAFAAFWAAYAFLWGLVAWHGTHFHSAPRPAALFLNLGEISSTPLPDWSEVPWIVVAGALALGWLARAPSPRGRDLRVATLASALAFAALHGVALIRYQTADMLRFSSYRDLVRTQGLEGAVLLDCVDILRGPDGASVFRELRADVAADPPVPLPVDPVAPDRIVIVQIESLDREAITPEGTPNLLRLWNGATSGLVNPLRTSVSGSSSADFQLLTGLRPLTAVPVYRLAWDGDRSALPAYAAKRGFSFHAYHGNDRHFWGRGPFFDALGVRFHTDESIPQTEPSRWGRADGDLFRSAAARIRERRPAVHFLITLSSHAPYDLVDPAAHLDGATVKTRYLESIAYVDHALGTFLRQLPRDGRLLVALYGDHTSGLFESGEEAPVPLILGFLADDGSLAPLATGGHAVHRLPGIFELPALHRYLEACLDASAR